MQAAPSIRPSQEQSQTTLECSQANVAPEDMGSLNRCQCTGPARTKGEGAELGLGHERLDLDAGSLGMKEDGLPASDRLSSSPCTHPPRLTGNPKIVESGQLGRCARFRFPPRNFSRNRRPILGLEPQLLHACPHNSIRLYLYLLETMSARSAVCQATPAQRSCK
jgi:hypothetical protein